MKRILFLLLTMAACIAAWAAEPYVVYTPDNSTLTFYYGTKPSGAYSLNAGQTYPEWFYDNPNVTQVVFDPSFAQARPTSTAYWLYGMTKLTNITGINYLNTSNVVFMSYMFGGCQKLTNLDLTMFNTSKASDFQSMFYNCVKLTSLDLSSFNTSGVYFMPEMFYNCSNLTTIIVSDNWSTESTSPEYTNDMFKYCTKLVGGAGTTYDPNHVGMDYAHIDGGPSNPGYFTGAYNLWINGVRVTDANKNGVTGAGISGSVTYEPSTNTLTLDNATIDQRSISECAISTVYGAPANLKINLVGINRILANTNTVAINVKESQGFTLCGSGILNCLGTLYLDARDYMTNDATMSYIKNCSVYINQIISEDYEECLTINNADVTTEYLNVGSDHNGYKGLNLVNCYLKSPADGVVGNFGCIMVNGDFWHGHVEIKHSGIPGDVNGDGFVTAADVTALYDYMLNNDSSNIVNGDQDGDDHITAGDITTVYTIMLGN
jgi:surface protein